MGGCNRLRHHCHFGDDVVAVAPGGALEEVLDFSMGMGCVFVVLIVQPVTITWRIDNDASPSWILGRPLNQSIAIVVGF